MTESAAPAPVQIRTKPRTKGRPKPPERLPLMVIDDVEYTMLANPPVNVCLDVVREFQLNGSVTGAQMAIRLVAGEDAVVALTQCPDLEPGQYRAVVGAVMGRIVGVLNLDSGN